jgi:hypothetical protein
MGFFKGIISQEYNKMVEKRGVGMLANEIT